MKIPPVVTITQDTTRGLTSKVVKAGTVVNVIYWREDEDGMKLLVRIGSYGQPFQIPLSVTDGVVKQ